MMYYMPSLKLRPDAIKAAVLASCDRKVTNETLYYITDKEGAGVVNANKAISAIHSVSTNNIIYDTTDSTIDYYYTPRTSGTKTFALSWIKQNTGSGTNHYSISEQSFTDFDLAVYDSAGDYITSSTSANNIAELLRFNATAYNTYKIRITRYTNNSTLEKLALAYVG